MSSSAEIARADLNRRLRSAETTLRRLVRGILALGAACVILVVLVITLFVQRGQARDYYNEKIDRLVCGVVALAPPHRSAITDHLRAGYHCPPYKTRAKRHHPRPTS